MARPLLDEIELQHVQHIDVEDSDVAVPHAVPALEGDFIQRLNRRAVRASLTGVLTGPDARDKLRTLREKFRAAVPVTFVADATTATRVGDVLIKDLEVTELAGKPERFAYAFTLREFIPPPPVSEEPPPVIETPESPAEQIDQGIGTLVVETNVEGRPDFDFSRVSVVARRTLEDGTSFSQQLTNRENNVFTAEDFPVGEFMVEASATASAAVTASTGTTVQPGATAQVSLSLAAGAVIAKSFVVHSDSNKAFVHPCMRQVLSEAAQHAAANPTEKLVIVANTDLEGSASYNQSLSERRARAVFAFLRFGLEPTVSQAEWELLRVGPTGSSPSVSDNWDVREYQYILQDLGFYSGNVNGAHDAITNQAVQTFRATKGLPAGDQVDGAVWTALIEEYMKQDSLSVPDSQFLDNCPGEILKWLGCGEQDPIRNTNDPWRPNRRVDLLFVAASALTCEVPEPDTNDIPTATNWCLGPGNTNSRCCFITRDPAVKGPWLVRPIDPRTITVRGAIKFADGTPAPNIKFELIAPDGEFMDGERSGGAKKGRGFSRTTPADGTFEYTGKLTGVGVYTMEIEGDFVVHLDGSPPESAKGNIVCKRFDGSSGFDVIVTALSATTVDPVISPASTFVVVKKPHTSPARLRVTLTTNNPFTGTGTFTRSKDRIRFFTAAAGGTEVTFNGSDNVFTGVQLTTGLDLFAESNRPSDSLDDVDLTLTLRFGSAPVGPPSTISMTAVELQLDISETRSDPSIDPNVLSQTDKIKVGRFVLVQDGALSRQRAIVTIGPTNPLVSANLVLTTNNTSQVELFAVEDAQAAPVPQTPVTLPFVVAASAAASNLFAQGAAPSAAIRDTELQLGIDGVEPDGDRVAITVFPDPSIPGPFPVGELDYATPSPHSGSTAPFPIPTRIETLGTETRFDFPPGSPATVTTPAFDINIRGLVRYPAESAGIDTPVSTGLDRYPLIVIAHGNHRSLIGTTRVENFTGLEYLARHFASYGYIAISIDLDDMNIEDVTAVPLVQVSRAPAITQRGLAVLEHIRVWDDFDTSHPRFTGRVDMTQIALVGHSRGGEAVVSAQKTNIDNAVGRDIRVVASIAPTDFLGIDHTTTPYLVIYGSEDGDVSIGWPFRLYDRANPLKAMTFIYGAIHNRFSTHPDWLLLIDSTDPRRIAEAVHLNIARGYCLGFLELLLRQQHDHTALFKESRRPNTVPAAIEIHHQIQDPAHDVIDDFEQGVLDRLLPLPPQLVARAVTNTIGNPVSAAGLAAPVGLANARTEASLRKRDLPEFDHETIGGMIRWDSAGGTFTSSLGSRNVSAFRVLSFRVTQRFGSPQNPPAATKDFSVRLVDTSSPVPLTADVPVATITDIPFPYVRSTASLTKSALKTVRIPLSAFTTVTPALDLTSLSQIVFVFDRTATGEIAIDDIEFSN